MYSQMWRGTSSATPGYSVFGIIPRRRRKSKFFLSVVNPVVRAAFQPGLVPQQNPANARVSRLSGLRLLRSWMKSTALPKQARYQLRYTRLLSCFIRLGVFSQSRRATNCATPGYSNDHICPCGLLCPPALPLYHSRAALRRPANGAAAEKTWLP